MFSRDWSESPGKVRWLYILRYGLVAAYTEFYPGVDEDFKCFVGH